MAGTGQLQHVQNLSAMHRTLNTYGLHSHSTHKTLQHARNSSSTHNDNYSTSRPIRVRTGQLQYARNTILAESTPKGVNWRSKDVTQAQHACKYKVHKLHQRYILNKGCSQVAYIPYISDTLGDTGVHRHKTEPFFLFKTVSFDLETGSP